MDNLLRDMKHSLRSLIKDRGFAITVLVTLTICIGANTAIFAVVHSVLLKPLPVFEANQLILMSNRYPKAGVGVSYNSGVADLYDRRRDVTLLEDQSLFQSSSRTLEVNGSPERIAAMAVTPSLFRLLHVSPMYGRAFIEEEGEVGSEQKVILSDGLARQLFGNPQDALGKDLRLSGRPFQVVGVMSPSFNFVDPEARMWVPLAFTAQQKEQRHSNNFCNIGRLKPGATIAQVQAQLDALNAANNERFPQFKEILINAGFYTSVEPLSEMLIRDVRGSLYLLWGGAVFVLLIGALNVANLVVARTALRRKELATRLALGATPVAVTRQLIVENLMVALMGGAAGAALGSGLLELLRTTGLKDFPRASEVHIDATVWAAVFGMSVMVGILIGLIPAAQVFRAKVNEMMREDGRTGTGRRARRIRQSLVVAEIGLAFVLLVGAGLLLASFRELLRVDPGYVTRGVVTASTVAPRVSYKNDQDLNALMQASLEAIRRIPGVAAAGATSLVPLSNNHSDSVILAEGYQMKPGESLISPLQSMVTPGYFEAMNIAVLQGRTFEERDRADGPLVAIVDERLANYFWPNQNPVGKRMYQPEDINNLLATSPKTKFRTVVGVVRTVRMNLDGSGNAVGEYYFPFAQSPENGFSFTVKAAGDTGSIARSMRTEFNRVAPSLALFDVHTMDERADLSLASRKTAMLLALGFGGVALFLAAIGIYGVLAYLVTLRRREIGIRAALGCTATGIVQLVVQEGMLLLLTGLVLGAAGATMLQRAVASQIYGVRPLDPTVMASVVAALVLVALGASAMPARRAAGLDPARVLREE